MPLAPSLDTFGWFAADVDLYAAVGDILLPKSEHRFTRLVRLPDLDELTAVNSAGPMRRWPKGSRSCSARRGRARLTTLDVDDRYRCFRSIQAHEAWAAHGAWVARPGRRISPAVRERFVFGGTITVDAYARALGKRLGVAREMEDLLGDDGLLVLPTVPAAAPLASSDDGTEHAYRARALRLLCLSGLSGLPQITVPLGTDEGAPFGISLIGPRFSDRALIDVARRLLAGRA